MNDLYVHSQYTNEYMDHLYNVQIIEYDMRDAGLSLTKKYKLLPESTIRYLDKLPKDARKITMGNIQRENKEFRQGLQQAFEDGRKLFFDANELSESNVLSIKKDAIFTLKQCEYTQFDELQFAEKNKYSSYYKFNRYEYYYYSEGLDVKGISEENLLLHSEYMLTALHEFMFLMENSKTDKVIRYLKEFIYYYKTHQLPLGFYRELNTDSLFRLNKMQQGMAYAVEGIETRDDLLINYNYNTYLIPLIDIVLRRG